MLTTRQKLVLCCLLKPLKKQREREKGGVGTYGLADGRRGLVHFAGTIAGELAMFTVLNFTANVSYAKVLRCAVATISCVAMALSDALFVTAPAQ